MDKEDDTSISYSDIQLGSQLTNDFMTLIKVDLLQKQLLKT